MSDPRVIKPAKPGEVLYPSQTLRFPSFRQLLGAPPEKVNGRPKKSRDSSRDIHIAHEIVRIGSLVGRDRAAELVAHAYGVSKRTAERAAETHRAQAERDAQRYITYLVALGKLDPTETPPVFTSET